MKTISKTTVPNLLVCLMISLKGFTFNLSAYFCLICAGETSSDVSINLWYLYVIFLLLVLKPTFRKHVWRTKKYCQTEYKIEDRLRFRINCKNEDSLNISITFNY